MKPSSGAPLTVFELEQLPLCIRAVLILTAAEACGRPGSEAERLISIAVTGLRRTVELNFAGLTERHSIVERILKTTLPGSTRAWTKSRADYRRRTAMLALKTGKSEAATAAALIEQAERRRLASKACRGRAGRTY